MESNQKKILMLILLIISIIAFFVIIGLVKPFVRYILQTAAVGVAFYNSVFFISTFIFTLALWFPLVNGRGVRKACIVCIPFLLISLFLYLVVSSFLAFLIAGIIMGIGFSGTLYMICFLLVNNENKRKIINCGIALIPSLLIVIACFELAFFGVEISVFSSEAETLSPAEILSIRLSMMIFPLISLIIVIIIRVIERE